MLQQLDMEDEIITTTLIPTTTIMEETTTEIITTTTTIHPHAIPLPFAFAPLQAITDHTHENVNLEHYILEGDQIKIQLITDCWGHWKNIKPLFLMKIPY